MGNEMSSYLAELDRAHIAREANDLAEKVDADTARIDMAGAEVVQDEIDVPGLVRRARRVADLSQRQLAELLGVSQATIARWEMGHLDPPVGALVSILRLARLRIEVVDDDQVPVAGMRTDAVRDLGGRRYPAHLDVEPVHRIWRPRWDRPDLNVQCLRRARRDEHRRRSGVVPRDHPSHDEVVATLDRWRAERLSANRRRPRWPVGQETDPCRCPAACEEAPGPCTEGCPCRCGG